MEREMVTMDGSTLQMAHYCCECVLCVLHLDFAGSATLSLCVSLKLISNQSEVTWLWMYQINRLGLAKVWETNNNELLSE